MGNFFVIGVGIFLVDAPPPNIGSDQLSKWKRQFLDNASQVFAGKDSCNGHLERICQLEQLVGKLTLELEISKKALSIFGHPRSSSGSL